MLPISISVHEHCFGAVEISMLPISISMHVHCFGAVEISMLTISSYFSALRTFRLTSSMHWCCGNFHATEQYFHNCFGTVENSMLPISISVHAHYVSAVEISMLCTLR